MYDSALGSATRAMHRSLLTAVVAAAEEAMAAERCVGHHATEEIVTVLIEFLPFDPSHLHTRPPVLLGLLRNTIHDSLFFHLFSFCD